jgi:hypothetical protein
MPRESRYVPSVRAALLPKLTTTGGRHKRLSVRRVTQLALRCGCWKPTRGARTFFLALLSAFVSFLPTGGPLGAASD